MAEAQKKRKYGSPIGLLAAVLIGFACYFILPVIPSAEIGLFSYSNIIAGINSKFINQVMWFFINFTEPDFTAGVFSSVLALVGAAIAWRLAAKGSKKQGFSICYGSSNAWPWVLAAQSLSLLLVMYVFRYLLVFELDAVSWIPTFIVVVSAPAAITLMYGPSIPTLLTASIMPAATAAPLAYWLSNTLMPVLLVPAGIANLISMAFTGFVIMAGCRVLPWMKKVEPKPIPQNPRKENVQSASWFLRRVLADFTEPHFYGNEIASTFLLGGALLDWVINREHGLSGLAGNYLPAILLSQFVAGGIGVFLYADKFDDGGWYATYVPVVSAAPFCVLAFGTSLPQVLFIAVLAGVSGAPIASSLAEKQSKDIHGYVPNVLAMAMCTILVWTTMNMLPWFR